MSSERDLQPVVRGCSHSDRLRRWVRRMEGVVRMTVGFAAALDVDLSLTVDECIECMICGHEAVMLGIISTPCACPQEVCLAHYEQERPRWAKGDHIHCYKCPKTLDNGGRFIRWEKAK